jgi:hypothetical protein
LEDKEKAKPIVENFFVTLGRILRPWTQTNEYQLLKERLIMQTER